MSEKFWTFVAWRLPRPLVYWCAIRLMTNATVGKYASVVPTDLRVVDALKRWEMK